MAAITKCLCYQGIIQLEKELAYLGSVCAAALMKKDLALSTGELWSNDVFPLKEPYSLHISSIFGLY